MLALSVVRTSSGGRDGDRRGALLVAHSDGLATHWKLEQYPDLFRQDPALVAAMLYRDHARRRDDTSVVVCRLTESAS